MFTQVLYFLYFAEITVLDVFYRGIIARLPYQRIHRIFGVFGAYNY